MGYDMYLEDTPEAREVDSPAAAWARSLSGLGHEEGEDGYFRLNIWGMGTYRQAMDEVPGMLGDPEYSWPRPETFGVEKDAEGGWVREGAAWERFAAAERALLEGDTGGPIPLYKLGSNDGWLVTADECERSLSAWLEAGEPVPEAVADDADYWRAWIAFLARASLRGGFRVW